MLNGSTNTLTLQGGTILGGSVTTNGASLIVKERRDVERGDGERGAGRGQQRKLGEFDGDQRVGVERDGARWATRPATWCGDVWFNGSQALSGTGMVVFGNSSANGLYLASSGTMLVIGSGITVHGQSGSVGNGAGSVINQGVISADSGGTISVNAQPFSNQGLAQGINGGTLALNGSCNNTGTLNVSAGSALNLAGGIFSNEGALEASSGGQLSVQDMAGNVGQVLLGGGAR